MVDTVSIYISSSLEVVYETQNRVALCGVILVPRGQIEHLFPVVIFAQWRRRVWRVAHSV